MTAHPEIVLVPRVPVIVNEASSREHCIEEIKRGFADEKVSPICPRMEPMLVANDAQFVPSEVLYGAPPTVLPSD